MNRAFYIFSLASKLEALGCYTVESKIPKTLIAAKDDDFGIFTDEGQVRFKLHQMPKLIEELEGIYDDYKSIYRNNFHRDGRTGREYNKQKSK